MKKLHLSFLTASYTPFALIKGALFLLLLFGFCFALIHFTKLALLGWKTHSPTPPKEKEKALAVAPPEPVYYIVERKKSRAKAQYSPPKEIHFK